MPCNPGSWRQLWPLQTPPSSVATAQKQVRISPRAEGRGTGTARSRARRKHPGPPERVIVNFSRLSSQGETAALRNRALSEARPSPGVGTVSKRCGSCRLVGVGGAGEGGGKKKEKTATWEGKRTGYRSPAENARSHAAPCWAAVGLQQRRRGPRGPQRPLAPGGVPARGRGVLCAGVSPCFHISSGVSQGPPDTLRT